MKIKSKKREFLDNPLTTGIFLDVIKELRETFATKDDLQRLATKEDLEHFATKEDVRLIVKDELQGYVTKEDVRSIVKDELQGYATKEDIEDLEAEMKGNFRIVFEGIEGIGTLQNDHNKRITALEHRKN